MTSVKPKNAPNSAKTPQDLLEDHKILLQLLEDAQNGVKIKIKTQKTFFLFLHKLIVARICFQIYAIVEGSKHNSFGFWYYRSDEIKDATSLPLGIGYIGIELLHVVFAVLGVYHNRIFLDFHRYISSVLVMIQFSRVSSLSNIILDVINLFLLLMVTEYSDNLSKLTDASDTYSDHIDLIGSASCPCCTKQSTNRIVNPNNAPDSSLTIRIKARQKFFLVHHLLVLANICFQIYDIVEFFKYNSYGFWYNRSHVTRLAFVIGHIGIQLLQVTFAVLGVYRNRNFLGFHLIISIWSYLYIAHAWFSHLVKLIPNELYLVYLSSLAMHSYELDNLTAP